MSIINPLDELKSADGVSLHDLCPPVYVVGTHEIPGISEYREFTITKKHFLSPSCPAEHYLEVYFGAGVVLQQVFQSRARAAAHVADRARAVADKKITEAIEAALKEGGTK